MTTAQKTMTVKEVANRLIELCRKGQILEAQKELFSDDVTSLEPAHAPAPPAKGKVAVLEKGKQFASMIEKHYGSTFSDPIIGGNHFSIVCSIDADMKGQGRMKLEEICVFGVKEGKISSEQFFY
jgi:hypothetical protein